MNDSIHQETHAGFNIEIFHDDSGMSWGDHIPCEPISVVAGDGWGRAWEVHNCNVVQSDYDLCRALDKEDSESIAETLEFELNETATRFGFQDDCDNWHYFKSDDARIKGMLKHAGFEHFRFKRLQSQSDTVYCYWNQEVLDKWAGLKNAKAATESCQHVLNGEIYGFTVEDSDGEHIDSCWGFIGDMDYCLKEACDSAFYARKALRKARLDKLKTLIRAHVPLINRPAILNAITT